MRAPRGKQTLAVGLHFSYEIIGYRSKRRSVAEDLEDISIKISLVDPLSALTKGTLRSIMVSMNAQIFSGCVDQKIEPNEI